MNDRLNMMVVLTEVIWKLKQYGNNFIAVFPIFPLPSKMFLNFSANNPLAGSWNQSDIERNAIWKKCITSSFNNECPPRSGKMDFVGLIQLAKRVIKWSSFNKTDFFSENNFSESNI